MQGLSFLTSLVQYIVDYLYKEFKYQKSNDEILLKLEFGKYI